MATTEELLQKYFVQPGGTPDPTSPVPPTFSGSRVTPLLDTAEYNREIEAALATVGQGNDKVAAARDEFILISNWWLGLAPGAYNGPSGIIGSGRHVGVWDTIDPRKVDVPEYFLDGPPGIGGTKSLKQILIEKANRGVDVRVLGWVSYGLMGSGFTRKYGPESYIRINAITMNSLKELRKSSVGTRAVMNVVGHTGGATHLKMVIVGNATNTVGFTGGLDFDMQRWSGNAEPGVDLVPVHTKFGIWHDVVAKVEGPGAQGLYDAFQKMWHENISRPARVFNFEDEDMPSFMPRTPVLPARNVTITPDATRKHHVQSLRTVCPFNYSFLNCVTEGKPASFAPDGLFEIRRAWEKGIRAAEKYIYMEDQSFWSQEVMTWLGETLRAKPNLRAVLVTSGGADPNDPAFSEHKIFTATFNHGLFKGLAGAELERVKNQIRFFKLWGNSVGALGVKLVKVEAAGQTASLVTVQHDPYQTVGFNLEKDFYANRGVFLFDGHDSFLIVGNEAASKGDPSFKLKVKNNDTVEPVIGEGSVVVQKYVLVHTKTTLVDDQWALIGSANCMRRSLYTDWEHSVSFIDEDQVAVKQYRKRLWNHLFRHDDPEAFEDIESALHSFNLDWGVAGGAAPPLPKRPAPEPRFPYFQEVNLPISPEGEFGPFEQAHHDLYDDLDARESWGGLCTVISAVIH